MNSAHRSALGAWAFGDPLSDARILQDQKRIVAIMKDGRFHKASEMAMSGARD